MPSNIRLPAPSNDASRSLDQYKVYKQLYKGETSMVLEAMDRRTGAHVVLKVYNKRLMENTDRSQLEREMGIHSSLRHDNIVDLITVFEDDQAFYLVQSFAQGGDLFSAMHAVGHFDESRTAGTIIAPLLAALDYIHSKGIIHRDIKVENILLDLHGAVKLADFGLAIDCSTARPGSRLGTWEYMAPEIHLCPFKGPDCGEALPDDHGATYSSSVDVWAVGVLAYELLVGEAPFQLEGGQMSYDDVMSQDLVFPDALSNEACSFIRSALCKEARHRPSARQLLQHRWLRPFLKADLLDICAAANRALPQTAFKTRGNRSLQLLVHLPLEPARSESVMAGMEYLRQTPLNSRARDIRTSDISTCSSSKAGTPSSAGGMRAARAAAFASDQQPGSPTSPLSYTSSTRTSEESSNGDDAGSPAAPRGRLGQPRAGGSFAAAAARLFRRLPSKIQSLMNLSVRLDNQVQPLLPAAASWSAGLPSSLAKGPGPEDSGSRASIGYDKAELQGGLRPGAAGATACGAWTEAAVKHAKGSVWSLSNLGGRRSVEGQVQHSAATTPDLSRLLVPAAAAPAAPCAAPQPCAGQRRSMSADRDVVDAAAERVLQSCQTMGPSASERQQQPTGGSRLRYAAPASLRSATCSDLQLRRLASEGLLRGAADLGPVSPCLYRGSGMYIPGSTTGSADGDSLSDHMDMHASLSVSPAQHRLRSPKAPPAAIGVARDNIFSASRSYLSPPSPPSGCESRPGAEAGQSMREAGRSRTRRLAPIVQVNSP